ncbi:MAG: hypothetical protein HZA48_00810 [Planctomycetes bacterium]|nr:hypothetical protein [Planctomycetota bacterium]
MAIKKKPSKDEPEEIMDVSETVDMGEEDSLGTTETVTEAGGTEDLQATIEEPQEPVAAETYEEPQEAIDEKPKSNIFTFMLIVAIVFTITSIVLVVWELNQVYDCTFGGMLNPPPPDSGVAAPAVPASEEPAPAAPAEQPNPDKGN